MPFVRHYQIDVRVDARPKLLGWPAQGLASYGRCSNHQFQSMHGARWRHVDTLLKMETALLQRCADNAIDEDTFDRIFAQAEEEFGLHSFDGGEAEFVEGTFLDLGVAAATLALNVAGCPTVSSCNGGRGHDYDYATIALFARKPSLPLLHEAATSAGVGLLTGAEGWVEVFGDMPDALVRFAKEVRSRSAEFGRMKMPLTKRRRLSLGSE